MEKHCINEMRLKHGEERDCEWGSKQLTTMYIVLTVRFPRECSDRGAELHRVSVQ